MKLVSACLLGCKCRYDGKSKPDEKVIKLMETETLVPVCPEVLGGLPTPRIAQESTDSGELVIINKAKVMNKDGKDITKEFIKGAKATLKIAKALNITEAILKQKSPSCGCGKIYNGKFDGTIVKGDGVTTALLKKNNIKCITEEEL